MDAISTPAAPAFQGMPLTEAGEAETAVPHIQSRGERIAIVDDEKIVLTVTEQVLEQFGYSTTAFNTTARCLKEFSSGLANYDLLITDLTMPGMTGLDLARSLRL